jgi:hypothetical protein
MRSTKPEEPRSKPLGAKLSFTVAGTYTSANFKVGADASGHVLVTFAAAAANTAIDELGGGSSSDLLGRYDSLFSMPIAGAHTGGPADRHDGIFGGARDAWGVGWDGQIGHGPGSAS